MSYAGSNFFSEIDLENHANEQVLEVAEAFFEENLALDEVEDRLDDTQRTGESVSYDGELFTIFYDDGSERYMEVHIGKNVFEFEDYSGFETVF